MHGWEMRGAPPVGFRQILGIVQWCGPSHIVLQQFLELLLHIPKQDLVTISLTQAQKRLSKSYVYSLQIRHLCTLLIIELDTSVHAFLYKVIHRHPPPEGHLKAHPSCTASNGTYITSTARVHSLPPGVPYQPPCAQGLTPSLPRLKHPES